MLSTKWFGESIKRKNSKEQSVNSTEKFFVECVKRGIKKEKIEFVPDGLDYQQFYKLCAAHSMSVAVVRALEQRLPMYYPVR